MTAKMKSICKFTVFSKRSQSNSYKKGQKVLILMIIFFFFKTDWAETSELGF